MVFPTLNFPSDHVIVSVRCCRPKENKVACVVAFSCLLLVFFLSSSCLLLQGVRRSFVLLFRWFRVCVCSSLFLSARAAPAPTTNHQSSLSLPCVCLFSSSTGLKRAARSRRALLQPVEGGKPRRTGGLPRRTGGLRACALLPSCFTRSQSLSLSDCGPRTPLAPRTCRHRQHRQRPPLPRGRRGADIVDDKRRRGR